MKPDKCSYGSCCPHSRWVHPTLSEHAPHSDTLKPISWCGIEEKQNKKLSIKCCILQDKLHRAERSIPEETAGHHGGNAYLQSQGGRSNGGLPYRTSFKSPCISVWEILHFTGPNIGTETLNKSHSQETEAGYRPNGLDPDPGLWLRGCVPCPSLLCIMDSSPSRKNSQVSLAEYTVGQSM